MEKAVCLSAGMSVKVDSLFKKLTKSWLIKLFKKLTSPADRWKIAADHFALPPLTSSCRPSISLLVDVACQSETFEEEEDDDGDDNDDDDDDDDGHFSSGTCSD